MSDVTEARLVTGVCRPGTVLRDRYELAEILDLDEMTTTYRALDLQAQQQLGRSATVAVSVFHDIDMPSPVIAALESAITLQRRFEHPNIQVIHDFGRTEGGGVYFVTELLAGQSLNWFIKKQVAPRGGLAAAEGLAIVREIGAALSLMHGNGLVHGSLNWGNVVVLDTGHVKVCGFWVQRALGVRRSPFVSLEMLLGEAPDARDDVYSLACLAYLLLCGRKPYDSVPASHAYLERLRLKRIEGLSANRWLGLSSGLALAREDRTASVAKFLNEIEHGKRRDLRSLFGHPSTGRQSAALTARVRKYVADTDGKLD